MKKYIFLSAGLIFTAILTGVFVVRNVKRNRNFKPPVILPNATVVLNAGGKTAIASYEDLGVSLRRQGANAGFASVLSSPAEQQSRISVDPDALARTVLRLFPFLNSQDDAHRSFFITAENQEIKPTFNLRALVAQLSDENLQKVAPFGRIDGLASPWLGLSEENAEVEVEIVPEEESPLQLPENAHEKTLVLRTEVDDVPILEWKLPLHDINLEKLKDFLANQVASKIERPVQHAQIEQFSDESEAVRAQVAGIARDGISLPIDENARQIQEALAAGALDVQLKLKINFAYAYDASGVGLRELQLLSVGRSNFAGSPQGRIVNIQKGLRERMNNIVVPPGATFSFNNFLGPLTAAAGWKPALGIFGGNNLKPTLGGGLCQVSTTVYRAALKAGLPIVKRTPHSLYVNYYKKYGEGLDATVFVGGPDLVFLNDTPSYILIQSYDDGDDGYVKIFGVSDGRRAALAGPYHFNTKLADKDLQIRKNEIAWLRTVEWPDGRKEEETITSRYRAVPHR